MDQTYLLEIILNKNQITKEDLERKANEHIRNQTMELNIIEKEADILSLSLKGEFDDIDFFHRKISEFIREENLDLIRIIDEVGDIVRQQAYPILSKIEQRFRAFINQVIVETEGWGFGWWNIFAPPAQIRDKANTIYEQSIKEKNIALHPLECTLFEDLIKLINSKIFEISEEETVTIGRLKEILSECNSVDDLKTKLEEKTRKISYWEEVFSCYFEEEKWEQLKQHLTYIVKERNKVMHHRPIYHGAIAALENKQQQIFEILDSAKSSLTEEELQEVKELRTKLQEKTAQAFTRYWLDSSVALKDAMEVLTQHGEMIRKAMEISSPQADAVSKAMEAFSQNAEMIRKATEISFPQVDAAQKAMEVFSQNAEMIRKATEISFPQVDAARKAMEVFSQNAEMIRRAMEIYKRF